MVEGLKAYASIAEIPGPIDLVTVYVPPEIGERLLPDIASKRPAELWINPGAESDGLLTKAAALGLAPIVACSIMGVGENPGAF
jgi:predicted CoA-binding protein